MSLMKRSLYLSLIMSSLSLTGCVSYNKNEPHIEPRHTLAYYHRPSEEVNQKYDLSSYSEINLDSLQEVTKSLEDKLNILVPLDFKIGKPKKIKAKPGIFKEVNWNKFIEFLFPESQPQ